MGRGINPAKRHPTVESLDCSPLSLLYPNMQALKVFSTLFIFCTAAVVCASPIPVSSPAPHRTWRASWWQIPSWRSFARQSPSVRDSLTPDSPHPALSFGSPHLP